MFLSIDIFVHFRTIDELENKNSGLKIEEFYLKSNGEKNNLYTHYGNYLSNKTFNVIIDFKAYLQKC